ncbi:MAG: YibE/F family protein [Spirochaetales bacterium]|nr:YibE/F family protein [Spirochaetales bacterium]
MKASHVIKAYFSHAWSGVHAKDVALVVVTLLASLMLLLVPTGYERIDDHSIRAKARVIETHDDGIINYGVIMQGEQIATVEVLTGQYAGLRRDADNILYGKADLDKLYRPGDKALVVIDPSDDGSDPASITLVDHWRLDLELLLVGSFFILLLLYGGWTGFKTMTAFAFSAIAVWKLLIPAFLAGVEPVLASLGLVALLSAVICYLVAGFTKAGTAAFLGSLWGTATSAAIALLLARPYNLNGAVRPFSETLRFGGFEHLNLTSIFLAGTFLASSGAIMDLAIDVAVALEEVHKKRPELGFIELVASGFTVGRKVFGTMTTTLLLAYTGGFTSLLMVFMAQGVPALNMFTISYVSSELFHTMIGSLGLVFIAPFTAVLAAALFAHKGMESTLAP